MAEPRTIQVGISGTSAVEEYQLAPGLAQYVESVYAEIDNSAGGDAQPLVTLSDQSGVVIAKKRQGDAIDAGTSGSATWALRLADEARARRFHGGGLEGLAFTQAINDPPGASDTAWTHSNGDVLLDVSGANARSPVVLYAGVYSVVVCARANVAQAGKWWVLAVDANRASNPSGFASQSAALDDPGVFDSRPYSTLTMPIAMAAGDTFDCQIGHNAGTPVTFQGFITVQRQELA